MCLLIAKPANTPFPKDFEEICKKAASANPHGSGFATPGGLFKKYIVSDANFFNAIKESIDPQDPAIIHFRYSTSGTKNDENCHPFALKDGGYVAHNGVISNKYSPTAEKSDTAMLAAASADSLDCFYRCREVASINNKFAILTPKNELVIVGEEHGKWEDGLWFSNMSWKSGRRVSAYDYEDSYCGSRGYTTTASYRGASTGLDSELRQLVSRYGFAQVVNSLDKFVEEWSNA